MKIGYLHLGPPKHGVCRYGRLLAAETKRRNDVEVIEASVELSGGLRRDLREIVSAARLLSAAEIIHFQFDTQPMASIWGPGLRQLANLRAFTTASRARLMVTVHSTRPVVSRPDLIEGFFGRRSNAARPKPAGLYAQMRARALRWGRLAYNLADLERVLLRNVGAAVDGVLVCSNEEAARISARYPAATDKVRVIPHFVETRTLPADRDRVRRELGFAEVDVVSLVGFLHERKGHRLLIEALAHLPPHVVAVFAGKTPSGWGWYAAELTALARERGVHDRIRFTGYLSETELERYMAATDLAVCPFESLAASGSLSSWIAAGRPILASDLPQIAEYNRIAPGAVAVFAPYDAATLAAEMRRLLAGTADSSQAALGKLRDRLSLERIAALHRDAYRESLGR